MGKKNPNVFTIGFNSSNPAHLKVVEILNQTERKAELIASAILAYTGELPKERLQDLDSLKPFLEQLIQTEIQKAKEDLKSSVQAPIEEPDEPLPISDDMVANITSALTSFRR